MLTTIKLFKEAVVVSEKEFVYVFPLNMPNTVFVWDAVASWGDWAHWYVVIGHEAAYKMVLSPRGPNARFGTLEEPWDRISIKPSAVKISPGAFLILAYVASVDDLNVFAEPKLISIRDFDRRRVRALATRLRNIWYRLYEAEPNPEEFEDIEFPDDEEDPCINAFDPDDC